ncbi:MAG: hypothetical protein IRY87_25370, partial [Acetobacteraceae bacterium]|nr:hypothetical protein [Acetobacteraceae bacterium]
ALGKRAWSDPKPIPPDRLDPRRRAALCDQAARLLAEEFAGTSLFVLQDSRLSRLLPIWIEAFRRAKVTPGFLILVRNPLEAAAALEQQHSFDLEHAQQLWLSHYLAAEEATRPHPRAVLHHDQLLADWRGALLEAYGQIGCDALSVSGDGTAEVDALLAALPRPDAEATDRLLGHPALSPLVKDLYCDLRQSIAGQGLDRERWHRARDQFLRAWQLMSPGEGPSRFPRAEPPTVKATPPSAIHLRRSELPAPAAADGKIAPEPAPVPIPVAPVQARSATSEAAPHRHIILHYHLFKNAGTSLDHALKAQFGSAWHEQEGPGPGWRASDIAAFLAANPGITVLSSHTALLPPPEVPNATIYPLIFVRHPLDRIRSIYDFESKQAADTEGARAARATDLKGYVTWRIARKGDRAIRNFQAYRFSLAVPTSEGTELQRALLALDRLGVVGVVERFDESLARIEAWLRPHFPELHLKPTRANVTQRAGLSMEERLESLRLELGDELYRELEAANQADLELYRAALARHEAWVSGSRHLMGAAPLARHA